ncbi:hypothetical protein DNU06_00965 [Putridiphycobacter roseus]|uniref:Secretion system C-terminal sorting domain-containing protein n=1 Tax=Putridiphycobacter roseus TaxID=2219161 RepID=A0A2W1NKQ0_9FLAO|nr:LamG-like jellyroll fold domain-containing protein [Putridiphycobacter roseus]PZE18436.1 hypothetical protein DNU06_00965 [Putridiphycobacter roseus]
MKIKLLLSFLALLMVSISIAQVPSYVPTNDLESYWSFSGNSNDASANASHLTNNGAVLTTDRFGNPNSAYSVNGTNQYLLQTNPSFTFDDADDFTVSVWVSKASTAGGVCLMNGSGTSGNFIWLLQGGATNMSFGTNKQSQTWISMSAPFSLNTWEHHVMVYEAGLMTYYKDNVWQSTANFTHTNTASANLPFYVGRGIGGSYFNGSIDDLGIWHRALSTCEINDLFTVTNTLLTVDAGSDATVCANAPYTLSGSGANTYDWDNGITDGVSFNPTADLSYIVTGTDINGCSARDTVTIALHPVLVNAGADITICDGNSVTLSGSGATTYTWDNGVNDGVAFTPTSTQTYTVTATDVNGCNGTDDVTINLYQPNIYAGPNKSVCIGNELILKGSGGATYVWDNGVVDSVAFSPTTTATYTVTGTDSVGCSNTSTVTITVNPKPIVSAGNDIVICQGDAVTLTGTGANFYNWNNGVSNGASFMPNTTATYVVNGIDVNLCTNKDSVIVTVNMPGQTTLNINEVDQYTLNGTTYDSTGTYTQILSTTLGCDSVITINLNLEFTGLFNPELDFLTVYPNPTSSLLQVKINPEQIGGRLVLYDLQGKFINEFELTNNLNSIDVRDLPNGTYTCAFYFENRLQKTSTFMKE